MLRDSITRILFSGLSGAGLGAAIGLGFALVNLAIGLPSPMPIDRWHTVFVVSAISIGAGGIVGAIAGLASGLCHSAVSFARSTVVVVLFAIVFGLSATHIMFQAAFLGAAIGGVLVAIYGLNCLERG